MPFPDLVLKVRVANSEDTDFIEIDASRNATFDQLLTLMRGELGLLPNAVVYKVRKLPDTILRNDRHVQRLRDYQEIELVLGSTNGDSVVKAAGRASVYTAAVSPKRIDVVY